LYPQTRTEERISDPRKREYDQLAIHAAGHLADAKHAADHRPMRER
jgi:hypothetical protein